MVNLSPSRWPVLSLRDLLRCLSCWSQTNVATLHRWGQGGLFSASTGVAVGIGLQQRWKELLSVWPKLLKLLKASFLEKHKHPFTSVLVIFCYHRARSLSGVQARSYCTNAFTNHLNIYLYFCSITTELSIFFALLCFVLLFMPTCWFTVNHVRALQCIDSFLNWWSRGLRMESNQCLLIWQVRAGKEGMGKGGTFLL